MQAKFLFTLLTINAVLLSTNAAKATPKPSPTSDRLADLGTNIAKLIDIDRPDLIAMAIDRAVLAQQHQAPQPEMPKTAGVPRSIPPQTDKPPTIRGRVAKPKPNSASPHPTDRQTADRDRTK